MLRISSLSLVPSHVTKGICIYYTHLVNNWFCSQIHYVCIMNAAFFFWGGGGRGGMFTMTLAFNVYIMRMSFTMILDR